jgi:hypothetical protein
MHARLNDMAIASTDMHKEHTLKLRVVQHKYAAQVATHVRALERHARKLERLHAKINAKATAIAGADFTPTMRAAALSKALELSMSLIWPTPWPIALIV